MKKCIAFVSAILIFASTILPSAFAQATESGKLVITTDAVEGVAGEIVTVNLNILENPGFASLAISVEYDENVLSLEKIDNGDIIALPQSGSVYNWVSDSDSYKTGVLATLTFKISNEAPNTGYYPIDITAYQDSCFNAMEDDVPLEFSDGLVLVVPDHEAEHSFASGKIDPEANTVSSEGISPFVSTRSGDGDYNDIRFLLAAKEDWIQIGNVVTVTFQKAGGQSYTIERTIDSEYINTKTMALYDKVVAAGITYTAGEGCKLFGCIVTGVPNQGFDTVTLSVSRSDVIIGSTTADYSTVLPENG